MAALCDEWASFSEAYHVMWAWEVIQQGGSDRAYSREGAAHSHQEDIGK